MVHYVFNLEIEPRASSIPEEKQHHYGVTVDYLRALGVLGQFSVQENGMMERGFREGLPTTRRAYFSISDNLPDSIAGSYLGWPKKLIIWHKDPFFEDVRTPLCVRTPLGVQGVNIHYEDGGVNYITRRRHGILRQKDMFLTEVARDYGLEGTLRKYIPANAGQST